MSEINKGYYAIIPANIRYDNEIPSNAKLLYAEITALCNAKGYCWADNKYFAELYGVSERTIYRWISKLIERGYIFAEYKYREDTREIIKRYLKLPDSYNVAVDEDKDQENSNVGTDKNVSTYCQKCQYTCGDKNVSTGTDKNVRDNNIIYNNNNIYNNNILSGSDNEPVDNSVDNSSKEDKSLVIAEIVAYLNEKCGTSYKTSSEKTKKHINARLNEGYSLADFKKVIDIKATEWLNNPEMCKYLRPQTLFGSNFESYLNQKLIQPAYKQSNPNKTNKFHNFIQSDDYSAKDLEDISRKRFEEKIKQLKIQPEKKYPLQEDKP